MFKSVEDKDSDQWEVLDLDTKKYIRGVQWANDDTGEYEVVKSNKDGTGIICDKETNEVIKEIKKGNIKLVRK